MTNPVKPKAHHGSLDAFVSLWRRDLLLAFRNINEIAAILDRNESTVKTHLYRALNKVRSEAEFFKDYRESLS